MIVARPIFPSYIVTMANMLFYCKEKLKIFLTLNFFDNVVFFAKKVNCFTIRIEMEDEWNRVCLMYALSSYKSNTPFSVKWLSYTFLAPGIQIVREINTCGCITQEGNGSQRFHKVVKCFLKEHYYFHENFLQSSHW